MYSSVCTGALKGISAYLVQTEVDVAPGLPGLEMVGYLAGEVKEARERVRVALKNAGISLPPMKITVNLSPADVRKGGTGFDLPMAVGIVAALGKIPGEDLRDTLFIGELGLDGQVRRVKGILPIVQEASRQGIRRCVLPAGNAMEGAVVQDIEVIGVSSLEQLLVWIRVGEAEKKRMIKPTKVSQQQLLSLSQEHAQEDFGDIVGQEMVKRAAAVAAAGFHNMLIIGPPGTGKTMVGKRIPGILPPMTWKESLEVSNIYSVQGLLDASKALVTNRPFMQPHHTISAQALAGGGNIPKPGVISLAHKGILFLDEFPEFPRPILDILRQPLEEKRVVIARTYGSYQYPADFMLVAAMNPCPCGYFPDSNKCNCSEADVRRYLGHISGPVLDRIDICVEAQRVDIHNFGTGEKGMTSEDMAGVVSVARKMQEQRFVDTGYRFNSEIRSGDIRKYCSLGQAEERMLEQAMERQCTSVRTYHRTLRTARTVADLEGCKKIGKAHIAEALCYRTADEKYWKGKG